MKFRICYDGSWYYIEEKKCVGIFNHKQKWVRLGRFWDHDILFPNKFITISKAEKALANEIIRRKGPQVIKEIEVDG